MHDLVFSDGRICPARDSQIGATTSAALYGRAVFTTVAIRKGEPFLWQKHLSRLRRDSASLGIDRSTIPDDQLERALRSCLDANQVVSGRARITIFDGSGSGMWRSAEPSGPSFLVTTAEAREVPRIKLTVAGSTVNSRSPLAGVKSCNYLERLLALEEARQRGFDEAVMLNERGFASSACMANLFWLSGGDVFTPVLTTGCLPGTTREFVMEKLECRETEAGSESLTSADAIFLTSAGIGVRSVAEFEGREIEPVDHPILSLTD
jgi:branched-subunit amino acid aminotransferase/4-amino-4-deoxychorismate lyase